MATQTCDCDLAKASRGMKMTSEAIESLLGKGAIKRGFDYEIDEDAVSAIMQICAYIQGGLIDKVSLVEPNGDNIKLVRNGYAVKVQRTSKKQIAI